jgi:hypothetical protein
MIGYTRVSKADGSQVHHLQHHALMCLPDCLNFYRLSVSQNGQLYHTRVSGRFAQPDWLKQIPTPAPTSHFERIYEQCLNWSWRLPTA